jgi:hypothetical protein
MPRRVGAEVEHLAHGIDLAVLRVDEPGFFELHPPVTLVDTLPDDQDEVTVLGYPMGGETMSATAGVVSRVEYADYYYDEQGLRIQIDAAVNPGNSGGPAFAGEGVIGAVFSRIEEGDNIGYVIPVREIRRFLDDVADGTYDGKPVLAAELATTENPGRRRKLDLSITDSGLTVIDATDQTGLEQWDVLAAVDGRPLDDQGYGELYGKRLRYPALLEAAAGESHEVPVTIIRDGERADTTVRMTTKRLDLFPHDKDARPAYLVHGPFVFAGATQQFAKITRHPAWSTALLYRQNPLATRRYERRAFPDEEIVVLANEPFPHPILRGHEDLDLGSALRAIDGVEVRNLAHAYELIRNHEGELIEFEFVDRHMDRFVTLDAEGLREATEDILDRHSIRNPVSDDLLERVD